MSPDDLVEIEDIEVVGDEHIEEIGEGSGRHETTDEEVAVEEDDIDETLAERLWGLAEMFPAWLRSGVRSTSTGSVSGVKHLYAFSRTALWIVFSSSVILMAPVIFEVERAQMDEMQKQQQRQILLGPNAAVVGGQPHFPMPMAPSQLK